MGLFAQKHADFLKAGERLVINLIDSVEPGNKDFNLFRKSRQKNLQQNQKMKSHFAVSSSFFFRVFIVYKRNYNETEVLLNKI
ncbi:unnamed protein product [Rotaria magnacalcarata]|uniref:Uncharacterized protein n=1 Tax=Rotaria magnacalcarata TaxID=392030 RepID=A0A815FXK7_9BILA|nr:unnamed protein product [Rotaria magnacalcarata]CAF1331222.1 unnamed protein product [Rotaria magnacalcarata]CAF2032267.1 unnamed protein product [Rotaria magnacalcarata]CAF2110222.1 unnamed protein product [Rotaria magnacalcarata]